MILTGKLLRDAVISGANNISNRRRQVDELNVFPVPDGDTGTNMSMTLASAATELGKLSQPTLTRAADVLNAWDDAPCVLEGHILEKIPRKDRYLFEDESGRVVVEIEHETFGHLTVTPQDKVRLVGHVDWSSKHPNEVEVDALAIIQ